MLDQMTHESGRCKPSPASKASGLWWVHLGAFGGGQAVQQSMDIAPSISRGGQKYHLHLFLVVALIPSSKALSIAIANTTIANQFNAQAFSYYRYDPSRAAAIIFTVVLFFTTIIHLYQLIRTRS